MLIGCLITVVVFCVATFGVWYRFGPRRAVGFAFLATLLVPQWVMIELSPATWFNVPTCVTVFSYLIFLFHSEASYSLRLRPCDWCVILMMLIHLISDTAHDGFQIAHVLRIYGEWFLPYLAGRLAIQSLGDVRGVMPIVAVVVVCFTVLGLVESLLKINLLEIVYGERPFAGPMPDAERFGLKRAHGPFMHSLFFGVVQVVLIPWALYFSQVSLRGHGSHGPSSGWMAAIPISVAGIASTLSRGPLLAVGSLIYGMQTLLHPRLRLPLAVAGVVAAAAIVIFQEPLMYGLDRITNEHNTRVTTKINGQEVQYTSAQHRKFLFMVYEYPLRNAGLLGWGTENTRGFPPNVPVSEVPDMVKAIDNAYLLLTLRFGYLGLAAFILMHLAGAYEFGRLCVLSEGDGAVWLAAMCSMVVTMMLIFMLVWMPQDIGYPYLFSLGSGAGIAARYAMSKQKGSSSRGTRRSHRKSKSTSSKESTV